MLLNSDGRFANDQHSFTKKDSACATLSFFMINFLSIIMNTDHISTFVFGIVEGIVGFG